MRIDEMPDLITGIECPKCHKMTGVRGFCPYKLEIDDATKEEAACNCCPTCRQECSDDI
jgi:hypothetical protein